MNKLIVLFIFSFFLSAVANAIPSNIGVIVPLSGPLAEYGVAIRNGIELSVQDHQSFKEAVQFVFEDSEYKSTVAVSAARKLSGDGARILYNFGGPTSEAIAPVVEGLKVPTFIWTNEPKVVSNKVYSIRFANSSEEYEQPIALYLKKIKAQRIAIVLTQNQYLNGLVEGLRSQLTPQQSLSVIQTYQPGDSDFRDSVTKLKNGKFDALGVFLLSGQVSTFYKRLNEQQVDIRSFGTDFFESSTEIGAAGPAMQSAVFANNQVSQEFSKRYISTFGNDSQLTYAGNGYDFATLAGGILSSISADADGERIVGEIKKLASSIGVLGESQYSRSSNDSYFKFSVVLKHVRGKNFEEVKGEHSE